MTRPHPDVTALLNAARGGHEPTAEQVAASVAAFTARLEDAVVDHAGVDLAAVSHASVERPSAKVARRSRKLPPRVLGVATGVLIVTGSLAAAASFSAFLRAIGWLAPPEPAPISVAGPAVGKRTTGSARATSPGSTQPNTPSAEHAWLTPDVAASSPSPRSEPLRPEEQATSKSQGVRAAARLLSREAASRGPTSDPVVETARDAMPSRDVRGEPSATKLGAQATGELVAIQRARDALNRGDHAAALQESRAYLLTYPNGMLVEEAYVVGALARCRSNGDTTSARAFVTRFPQSVFTHKLARECRLSQFGVPKRDDTDTH